MNYTIKQLTVHHGKQRLLMIDELTLNGPGLIAIKGPSGAGKSTLLMALAGLIEPSSGDICLAGEPLTKRSAYRWRQQKVGYLFQNFELITALSALDNVLLRADAMQQKADKRHAQALLGQLGICHHNKRAQHYSRGQQQRIALARALYGAPQVLLCDEPTASLDADNGAQVAQLLAEIASQKLVIVSTHDRQILACAGQIITLAFGQLEGIAWAA